MLELKNISISTIKDGRPMVKEFNLSITKSDKIAFIGEEGNGKSTLLKLMVSPKLITDYCSYAGEIIKSGIKIGYLEQSLSEEWFDLTVLDYFLREFPSSEIDYDIYNQYSRIQKVFAEVNLKDTLLDTEQKIETLSGGEKVKIQIAKLLINDCDLLLLDEPTNDLDIETLNWLETFISNANFPIVFVSHDETLLENTADVIVHLEQIKKKRDCRHTIIRMGYREYYEIRINKLQKQDQLYRSESKSKKEEEQTLKSIKYKVERVNPGRTNRMTSILAQEERLKQREITEKVDVEEAIKVRFNSLDIPSSKVILDLYLENLSIGNKILSKDISLNVIGPEHIVIIGENGIGKTTLLRKIYEELKLRLDLKVGYMPQKYDDLLDSDISPVDYLAKNLSKEDQTKARTYLGSMKFTSEEMIKSISNLSGGQRAKLLLIKLILDNCNVLILDEPTRNLSPLSNPVVREILADFGGAIISISHDRKYIEEVCNTVYILDKYGLTKKKLNNKSL